MVTPGDQRIELSWDASIGASLYRVSRNTTGAGAFTQIGSPTATSFTDQPLTNGATYYYVVAASNGSCWSADSAVASGTPFCTTLPVPEHLIATPGAGLASLSWAHVPGATLYKIRRKTGATGSYASVGTSPVAGFVDGPLANGTTYFYSVAAGNGSCDSGYGTEQSVTPALACSQSPPSDLQAVPLGSVRVLLKWTAAGPAPMTHTIVRSTTSGSGFQTVGCVDGTATTFTDNDPKLLKDKKYHYKVAASGSCLAISSEVSATTECVPPNLPTPPRVSNSNGALTVTWDPVEDATGYSVFRDTYLGGPFDEMVSTDQVAASYTDPAANLINGVTYHYGVKATNAGGQCSSDLSNAGSAMSCAPPAVPDGLTARVVTSGQVALAWTASPGASQYTILRGNSSGSEAVITPPGIPPTENSYTDTGLSEGRTYYYQVSAQNGENNACSSGASAEIGMTVGGTTSDCPVFGAATAGYQPQAGLGAYCFVTCWDLQGLAVSNFFGRSLTVNGTAITCGTLDGEGRATCTVPSGLARDFKAFPTSGAFVFRISAGSNRYPTSSWWGTPKECQ